MCELFGTFYDLLKKVEESLLVHPMYCAQSEHKLEEGGLMGAIMY